MDIGILALCFGVGLLDGLVLGLALAIWMVSLAGYDWRQVIHRWGIELVGQRYREEIEADIEGYRLG